MRASLARFFQAKDTLRQTAASIQPSVAWRRPLVWMKTSFCLQIGKRPKASSDKTPGRCLAAESSCPSSAKYCRQNGILIQDRAHSSRASSQSAKANHVARERAANRQGRARSSRTHSQSAAPSTKAQEHTAKPHPHARKRKRKTPTSEAGGLACRRMVRRASVRLRVTRARCR